MGNCPVCNARVVEDFGLVECAKCNAQLIVGIDGSVQVSSGDETPPMESISQAPQMLPPQQFADDMDAEVPPPEGDFNLDEAEAAPPAEPEPVAEVATEPPPLENAFDGSDSQEAADAPPVYRTPGGPSDSPNLSDLAAFANSEDSGGREGPLRYTLLIHGIDTADVREAFREALTDRKFMWDIEQILRNIRQGFVKIENVSPGKAFILINRLRNLPLQIRWEQHAITQP